MWENVPLIVLFTFIFGGTAITRMFQSWNNTRIEIAKIRASQNLGSGAPVEDLRAEIRALRAEISALRDTATQYDLSFDTALQHMESRVAHLERNGTSSQENPAVYNVNHNAM